MTETPYTTIRRWVTEQLDNGADPDNVIDDTISHFMDDQDFITALVSTVVRQHAKNAIRQSGVALQQFDKRRDTEPGLIPVPKQQDIVINMAKMTRVDLIAWAKEKRTQGDLAYKDAAFLLEIAQTLAPDETVGGRYSVEDLQRIRSRITIMNEPRIFIGDRQKSMNHMLPGGR